MPDVPTPASLAVRAVLAAVLRHVITLAGAALVARGLLDPGTADGAVEPIVAELAGLAMIIGAAAWSGVRSLTHSRLRAAWRALTGEDEPPASGGAAAVVPALLALLILPGLSGCATLAAGGALARGPSALAEVEAGYRAAAGFAGLFMPYMPPASQERVRAIGDKVERALAAARTAATVAQRLHELERARRELQSFRHATGN